MSASLEDEDAAFSSNRSHPASRELTGHSDDLVLQGTAANGTGNNPSKVILRLGEN